MGPVSKMPHKNTTAGSTTANKRKGRANRVAKAPQELVTQLLVGMPFAGQCCYSYNKAGCSKTDCPHPHICARCGQAHPVHKCPHTQWGARDPEVSAGGPLPRPAEND
eukprot:2506029-Amphidinium_carterae.1